MHLPLHSTYISLRSYSICIPPWQYSPYLRTRSHKNTPLILDLPTYSGYTFCHHKWSQRYTSQPQRPPQHSTQQPPRPPQSSSPVHLQRTYATSPQNNYRAQHSPLGIRDDHPPVPPRQSGQSERNLSSTPMLTSPTKHRIRQEIIDWK